MDGPPVLLLQQVIAAKWYVYVVSESLMNLKFDLAPTTAYRHPSQIARVASEGWFRLHGFCLACEADSLEPTANNTRACDFICRVCRERYELKTFRRRPTRRLVDGAYDSLISRLHSGAAPTLMLMERSAEWSIARLTAIHPLFLTPAVVERRRPLSATARRAGWVGCNIRLDLMGEDAAIEVIEDGILQPRHLVREHFKRFTPLREIPAERRGWTTLILSMLRSLQHAEFSLSDLYGREQYIASIYPENRTIRAKIRQQLQVLRDLGYVEFLGGGSYRLLI